MIYRTEDPARDAALWMADEEEETIYCEMCGEPITTDYAYRINGSLMCEDCMKDMYREWL